jgi:hypothetical protein
MILPRHAPSSSPHPQAWKNAHVEVVLCSFNGEKYIAEQVESILQQTLRPARLSIYDDASTDRTREILQEMVRRNGSGVEIVLHVNPSNLGYVRNFERGIRNATLDYIALCDQDDIWDSDKLEVLASAFEPEAGVVFSNALLVDADAASLHHTLWDVIRLTPKRQAAFRSRRDARQLLLQQNYVTGAALMMRRELAALLPPFPTATAHDYWIAIVVCELSNLKPVDQVLYKYRQHSRNVIGQSPYSLSQRVVKALQNADERYRTELQTYEQIAMALEGHASLREAHRLFQQKAGFLRERVEAVHSGFRGSVRLARLLLQGSYGRFCRTGAAMFAKDVMVQFSRCFQTRPAR